MFWLALALTVPAVLVTATIPVWAAWQFCLAVTITRNSLLWGLDALGLSYLIGTICLVVLKFVAPDLARQAWPIHRAPALFFIFTWFGAVVLCTGFVLIAVGAPLADMTELSDPHVLLVVSWPLLDTIASLLPTALMTSAAWRKARLIKTSNASGALGSNVIGSVRDHSTPTSHGIKESLFRFLQDVAQQPYGDVLENVYITRDGVIETSQGTLARLLHVSKSTINRSLQALHAEGHLRLDALTWQTRITVVNHSGRSCPERSGTNGATA